MGSYPIITKSYVKRNEKIKKVQKENKSKYLRKIFAYPKASITKVITENGYIDMVGKEEQPETKVIEKNELLKAIEENELTGMSGNGFPTYKKLKSVIASTAENRILIINGAECDPGLIHDEWLIRNRLEDIIFGSKLVSEMIQASETFLAIKLKNEAIEGINVKILPDRYPMGQERILIKQVLNVEVSKNEIPAKKGILVINVQTVIMIAEIAKGKFSKGSRYITVADYTAGQAKVVRVDYGMKAQEVLQHILGRQDNKGMYAGGGVMGAHRLEHNEMITPLTNFVGYGADIGYNNDSRCKGCGNCTRNCPMGIKVHKVVDDYAKNKNIDMQKYELEKCINCGTCTFLCQAGKNIMEIVNMLKNK